MRPALAVAARLRRAAVLVALLLAGLVVGPACRAERLPTEAFARLPFVVDASLSPSGERLALLLNTSAGRVLATRDGPTGPQGVGQRVWSLSDGDEVGILSLRQLTFT